MTLLRNNNFEQLSIWQTSSNCAAGCSSKASQINTEVTLTCFVSGFIRFKLLVEIFNIMLIPANWRLLFPKMLERTLLGGCEEEGKKQIFVLWFFELLSLYAGLAVILKASKNLWLFKDHLIATAVFLQKIFLIQLLLLLIIIMILAKQFFTYSWPNKTGVLWDSTILSSPRDQVSRLKWMPSVSILKWQCSCYINIASTLEMKSVVCSAFTDCSTPLSHVKWDSRDTDGMLTKWDTECHELGDR